MDLEQTLERLGGIASLEQLRARGVDRPAILAARHRGGVVHWRARTAAPTMARQPLHDVLQHVVECQPPALALAVLDSAVHEGGVSLEWLRRILDGTARGRLLATEIDGRAHHALVEGFARDRWLDREQQLRGYDVLRLIDAEVLHDRPRVLADIRRMVSVDRHRTRARR